MGGCPSNGCGNDQEEIVILLHNEGMVDYARNPVNSLKYLLLFSYQIVKVSEKLHQEKEEVETLSIQIQRTPTSESFGLEQR